MHKNFAEVKLFCQRIVWKVCFCCLCFLTRFDFLIITLLWLKLPQSIKKVTTNESWKLFKVNFWSISNMLSDAYKRLLNLGLFRNSAPLFLLSKFKKKSEATNYVRILNFEGDWVDLSVSVCLERQSSAK